RGDRDSTTYTHQQNGPNHWFYSIGLFDVDVERRAGQVFEHVLEPADGCTTGNTSSSYGRPGERRDPAAAIGRAIEIRIMVDHRNAVTRAVHVGLDIAVSFFGGSPVRGQ